jgi:hypothetical protein
MAKFNIITEEQSRALVGGDIPPEEYQEIVKGIRAVQDGKFFHVSPTSEAEARMYKRAIRAVAASLNKNSNIDFRVRMKDAVRGHKEGKKNFDFVVRQAKSDEIEAMEDLVEKRRAKRGKK